MSKVAKKNYVIEGKDLDAVISILTKRFNLPVVSSSLGIYSMSKGRMLEVMFQNSSCHVMSSSKNSTLDKAYIDIFSTTPPIQIENTNIKYFLKILNELGYSKAHITNEVTRLRYKSKDGLVVYTLNIGTPLGHLLVISCKSDKAQNLDLASYLKTEITSQAIDEEFSKISKERVFNGNGVLHNKIVNYGNKYGIDIASHGTASIK